MGKARLPIEIVGRDKKVSVYKALKRYESRQGSTPLASGRGRIHPSPGADRPAAGVWCKSQIRGAYFAVRISMRLAVNWSFSYLPRQITRCPSFRSSNLAGSFLLVNLVWSL